MVKSELSPYDLFLFHEGTNYHAQGMFGAHLCQKNGVKGVRFALWAPHAQKVSVVGDFNGWDLNAAVMEKLSDGQVWQIFIPHVQPDALYKYAIYPQEGNRILYKADPYAFYAERVPLTASRVYDLEKYHWHDKEWQKKINEQSSYNSPILIYEVHAGSWRRTLENEYLSYRDLAEQLISYVKKMHYTHIEFMPLCEHPFDGSWGYQITGYFAPTSRYGTPDDLRYLIDCAHQAGIGIIMDWVPGHFCQDEHGLAFFDGKNLYESDNPMRNKNEQWGTNNFDYGRTEVQSFLISNALYWFDEFHIDGIRIDAVANMLYLNYGKEDGKWQPNRYGGTGNLEAIDFIKKLNEIVFKYHPKALMIAEESTDWPLISKPTYVGGMGFNYKWNMGWMNDILSYISLDPIYRKWNHDKITFSLMYAFAENFVLPLSHDEVVHGKRSLLDKMPGDYWQKFAGLRLLLGYWMAHPGKKLLFMGCEFGQFIEWKFDNSLDWHLIESYPMHEAMQLYTKKLNGFYCSNPAFWQIDFDWSGFTWLTCDDCDNSIVAFLRKDQAGNFIIVVCNFTPQVCHDYLIGVPRAGSYRELFNSDDKKFGGSGVKNPPAILTLNTPNHGFHQSLPLTIPPLATIYIGLTKKDANKNNITKGESCWMHEG